MIPGSGIPGIPGTPPDDEEMARIQRKGRVVLALVAVALLVLVVRLGTLQIEQGAHYAGLATGERLRIVPVPAPRGRILDRSGIPLAANRPSFNATLVYTSTPLQPSEVRLLSSILGLPAASIDAAEATARRTVPYAPLPLKSGLSPREVTLLEEQRPNLPGVVVQVQPMRFYPGLGDATPGPYLASQVLGYVSRGKTPVDMVGRSGVEATYNGPLHRGGRTFLGLQGVNGGEQVVVDALGHPVAYRGGIAPTPGNDVVLTLDARLQDVAERALVENMQQLRTHVFFDGGPFPATEGAAVAIDPRNGQILALASVPSFNPNAFAQAAYALPGSPAFRQWQQQWAQLSSAKTPGRPLVDHAIGEISAPGSTFKPITALAALTSHVITPNEKLSCPASLTVGNTVKHNWVPGNWTIDLYQAIARSCDTYFYQVGAMTGINHIEAMARQFGLGQRTGLKALTGEVPGYVAGPDTQRALGYNRPWYVSETMDAAIGQGFNAFNPLEMANYVATLANGGTRYRPYLIQEVRSPTGQVLWRNHPQVVGHVQGVPAADFAVVRRAMEDAATYHRSWQGVADAPFGTAYAAFANWPQVSRQYTGHAIPVAVKTGTAQQNGITSNSWFICYAPANHPVIAIAVYVRQGDEGLLAGAPVARDMLSQYFGVPGFELAQPSW